MKTHKRLLRVTERAGGPRGDAHPRLSAGTARRWAAGGILALVLAAGGIGVAASAWPGQGAASHLQVRVHQPAHSAVLSADTGSASTISTNKLPWMY